MNHRILLLLLVFLCVVVVVLLNYSVKQKELTVNVAFKSFPELREKEITVKVLYQNSTAVKNANIYYEQISQNFMYNVGEYWDANATDVGSNTKGIYLDWWWGRLEPQDNVYNWGYLENTDINSQGELNSESEHVFLRLGVIATSAWIAGEKMDSFQETGYPSWVNKSNLTQVKEKYLEFVAALLNHLKFKPDFYMVEVEVNALGINAGMTNQEIIDWLHQLTGKIKEIDKEAKVSIVVTSHDLSPFMDVYFVGKEELIKEDRFPLQVTEFLERMKVMNYDIIATFIQPFGWVSKGDWSDAAHFLDSLSSFNKSVYIGWISFLAEEPEIPEELNPNPNNIHGKGGFVYYPNINGHSEEWQKEQTLKLMNYIISNPRIIGVHWDMLDYVETGTGGKNFTVKLATGFTSGYRDQNGNVIEGRKRFVYEPVKELWESLFSKGNSRTDESGVVKFNGYSGKYRITISHPDYWIKEMIINVR